MKRSVIFKEGLLVLVTMIWGLGFIAQKLGGDYLDAYTFNFCRNIVATIVLFIIVLLFDCIRKKTNNIKNEIDYNWNNKKLWLGGTLAGAALTFGMMTQQIGVVLEGPGKSGFLTALYIVFVPVIGFIFGKRINIFVGIALILSLLGLYLINVNGGEFSFSKGSILLLLCALGYSLQIIVIDKFSKGVDTIKFSFIQFLVAAILSFFCALIMGKFDFNLIVKALPAIFYLGIISSGVAYTLQVYAQTEVNVTVACIIMSLESVFSLICGIIFLQETHGAVELLGCLSILIAVILAQLDPNKIFKKEKGKIND